MEEIKTIPTKYKNTIFRSRLEARWAIFFDELGIKWYYEHEGFDMDGEWYLPDFYLPEFDGGIYAEVKPRGGDFRKSEKLAIKTKQRIWLCEGPPEPRVCKFLCPSGENGKTFVEVFSVIPCWDQAMDEQRFFWEPGDEEDDGTFDADHQNQNPNYMDAVEKANTYKFS